MNIFHKETKMIKKIREVLKSTEVNEATTTTSKMTTDCYTNIDLNLCTRMNTVNEIYFILFCFALLIVLINRFIQCGFVKRFV